MTFVGSFLQFLWHLFSISARVLALSLFATAYPRLIAVVGAAHWIVMVLWVLWQDTGVCNSKVELLFKILHNGTFTGNHPWFVIS